MASMIASTTTSRPFVGRVTRGNQRNVSAQASANWLPGSEKPKYLEGLPGNYGFDPLRLAETPSSLERFKDAEVFHSRLAMLGAAGVLGVEVLGFGNWYDAPKWALEGGSPTYFGVPVPFDLNTLLIVELVAMGGAEALRGSETDPEKRSYPGGAFDPFGLSKGNLEELKTKEIKNGRLAMVATLGFLAQHAANGQSPLQALGSHLSNPWANNFATNGVSIPFNGF